MEYRVLGSLEVERDGALVELGAFRQKSLLALLLINANSVVSTDQILDRLWGEEGASDKQNALWVYISGLRSALEPERAKRSEGTVLLTRTPGYVLNVDSGSRIDAVRFEHLVAEGRALAETDPAAASLVLGEALALWRGRAYEEFTYEGFAQAEIARLEEIRLEAVEARIDADLRRGMSRELVSELESLVREHPMRERLTGQLMLALYRAGRQAEALRSYQLLSARLGEELGIEPSTEIRALEGRIVEGDRELAATGTTVQADGPSPGLAVRGYELREKIGEGAFGVAYRAYQPAVGREVAIKVIRPELANDPSFIRRFESEAQLVAGLEHPHIVPLYDYWREPGAAYLVMRLMKGGSLESVLEDRALTQAHAAQVAEQVGLALDAAHRSGVVHRDIKPANILIDDEGNAYLSDFGIAVGPDAGPASAAQAGSTLGPPYASPEQDEADEVTARSDIYSLGVVLAQAITGLRGDVEQVRGALPTAVRSVIDRATAEEPSLRQPAATALALDLRDAIGHTGDGPVDSTIQIELENPYKGLRAFSRADAADFHGRERLIERLVARLGEAGSRGRFVAVVGPSGSGKSSAVRAGLVPALAGGALPLSDGWFIVEMTPAPHPFEALEAALLSVAVDPPKALLEHLTDSDNGLGKVARSVLPEDGSQLVLVIDQFEEMFTQVDEDTAQRFLDALVEAVRDAHSRIRVVVTLRADFYDRPLRHRGVGELVREGTEVITPMTPEELERAITGPAAPLGVTFEPSLVAELVRDVADRPGALPLLQYALTELFDARLGSVVQTEAYRALGGVSGALAERAEGLLATLGDPAQEASRQMFLRLVTLGEGADDTRRRVLLSELQSLPVEKRDLQAALSNFGRHRLLSFDRDPVTRGPTVEISHEALLTEWERLRGWIGNARDDVRNQRRLAQAMTEWEAAGQSDDYLLRGGHLQQLHGWATSTSLPLADPERLYLEASVVEQQRADQEDREREERAVEAERREKQRARQLSIVGVAAVVIAIVAVFAFVQRQRAVDAEAVAEDTLRVSELAAASIATLGQDPQLALLTAIEAARATAHTGSVFPGAVDALHWAIQELDLVYPADESTPVAVRIGPHGPTGVFAVPPSELIELAQSAVTRAFTEEECDRLFGEAACPDGRQPVPAQLEIFGGDEAYGVVPPGPTALAGTSVDFLGPWFFDESLAEELAEFEASTGISIVYEPGQIAPELGRLLENDLAIPDLISLPQPSAAAEFGQDLGLMDLANFLDRETLRDNFGDYLLRLTTIGSDGSWPSDEGAVVGIPIDLDLKGLVYYPRAEFDEAGYEVPETLDELLDLSRQIVADGRTPWCFGYESGNADGWPGTDLIESLVLRLAGPDGYDAWNFHHTAFDGSVVRESGRYLDTLIFEPGFARAGPESISVLWFNEQLLRMLEGDEPGCWLHHQGDFAFGLAPAGTRIGIDLDAFLLPSTDPSQTTPITGGGTIASATSDRPEVREFIRFLASPEWGRTWASDRDGSGNFISPNRHFDVSAYANTGDEARDAVRMAIGTATRDALAAGVWRFDASDLMPQAIGAFGLDGQLGAFWQGMLDHVDGTRTIDQVLADIEAAWVELEAAEAAERLRALAHHRADVRGVAGRRHLDGGVLHAVSITRSRCVPPASGDPTRAEPSS